MVAKVEGVETDTLGPSDPRRRFGNHGEDLAAVFLMSKGYRLLARNWSCRLGEIDLIAEKKGVVHFVEVKTRKTLQYGNPEEAITATKLRHLCRAVQAYISSSKRPPQNYQIDALAITLCAGAKPEFYYIENIGSVS